MTGFRGTTTSLGARWQPMLTAFALLALLFAVACDGDDSEEADRDTTVTTTADETPTETPTAASDGTATATGTPSGDGTPEVSGQYGLAPAGEPTPGPTEATAGGNAQQLALSANIGAEAPQDLLDEWDIDILPDGTGLPDAEGSVAMGADIFQAQCAQCHGADGTGTPLAPQLVLTEGEPGPWEYGAPRTVANYWPYLTTYIDYVNRAMPYDEPDTLTEEELYSVVAWILAENGMVEDDATLNQDTIMEMNELPNLPSFFPCFPDDCRPEPELTGGGAGGGQ